MRKFKKGYNLKVVSVILAGLFLLNSTVYGIDLSNKSHLRVPLISSIVKGKERFKEGLYSHIKDMLGNVVEADREDDLKLHGEEEPAGAILLEDKIVLDRELYRKFKNPKNIEEEHEALRIIIHEIGEGLLQAIKAKDPDRYKSIKERAINHLLHVYYPENADEMIREYGDEAVANHIWALIFECKFMGKEGLDPRIDKILKEVEIAQEEVDKAEGYLEGLEEEARRKRRMIRDQLGDIEDTIREAEARVEEAHDRLKETQNKLKEATRFIELGNDIISSEGSLFGEEFDKLSTAKERVVDMLREGMRFDRAARRMSRRGFLRKAGITTVLGALAVAATKSAPVNMAVGAVRAADAATQTATPIEEGSTAVPREEVLVEAMPEGAARLPATQSDFIKLTDEQIKIFKETWERYRSSSPSYFSIIYENEWILLQASHANTINLKSKSSGRSLLAIDFHPLTKEKNIRLFEDRLTIAAYLSQTSDMPLKSEIEGILGLDRIAKDEIESWWDKNKPSPLPLTTATPITQISPQSPPELENIFAAYLSGEGRRIYNIEKIIREAKSGNRTVFLEEIPSILQFNELQKDIWEEYRIAVILAPSVRGRRVDDDLFIIKNLCALYPGLVQNVSVIEINIMGYGEAIFISGHARLIRIPVNSRKRLIVHELIHILDKSLSESPYMKERMQDFIEAGSYSSMSEEELRNPKNYIDDQVTMTIDSLINGSWSLEHFVKEEITQTLAVILTDTQYAIEKAEQSSVLADKVVAAWQHPAFFRKISDREAVVPMVKQGKRLDVHVQLIDGRLTFEELKSAFENSFFAESSDDIIKGREVTPALLVYEMRGFYEKGDYGTVKNYAKAIVERYKEAALELQNRLIAEYAGDRGEFFEQHVWKHLDVIGEAYYLLGMISVEENNWQAAEEYFSIVKENYPDSRIISSRIAIDEPIIKVIDLINEVMSKSKISLFPSQLGQLIGVSPPLIISGPIAQSEPEGSPSKCLKTFHEQFKDGEVHIGNEADEEAGIEASGLIAERKKQDGTSYSRSTVYEELKWLIKLGLVECTRRGYYSLTQFGRELTDRQLEYVYGIEELGRFKIPENKVEATINNIYHKIQDLSRVPDITEGESTVVFFLGKEVDNNEVAFKRALAKLGSNKIPVVLVRDDTKRDDLAMKIYIDYGVSSDLVIIMTLEEAGIDPSRVENPEAKDTYLMQILGIDDLHCIPLTPAKLRLHPKLKEAQKNV